MKNFLLLLCGSFTIAFTTPSFSQAPTWAWAKNANNGTPYGLAKDNTGNTIMAGYFSSDTIKFGTTNLMNSNFAFQSDVFVTKYDANGAVVWAKGALGYRNDYGYGAATDAAGNTYVCGSFTSDTLTFGSSMVKNSIMGTNFRDVFIAKYDVNGNPLWAKGGGGSNTDEAYSVAVDAMGNCYVTGYFTSSTVVFGTYTLTQTGVKDMFITKYDSNGNILWAKNPSGNDWDCGRSLTIDPSGNVWAAGYFQSQFLTIGTTTLTNASWGFSDVFVLKFDPSGNALLGKQFGSPGHQEAYAISADPSGNVFMGGYFISPSFSIGTTTLTNVLGGKADWFLSKLDQNGNPLWAKSAGGTNDDVINSISADASGNVYTTGAFRNSMPMSTSTLISLGFQDAFVAKYNSAGTEQFAIGAGASFFDGGTAIVADNFNGCVVAGSYQDSIKFGAQPTLIGNGLFIAKSGSITEIKTFASGTNSHLYPNPTTGAFFIKTENEMMNIEVYNGVGEKIITSNTSTEIDLSKFPKGIYFVKLFNGDLVHIEKIIVQ